ncbi:hypothetical protein [Alicyclobacillus sendaiensis]|uniref:hypothetical protein n=1 Tax=Alicyclobacillus sendaiensis TaxID=192387 RepID=UPI0026F43C3E|nr:hypothetical protein [Alicyclobacillus sendaiensis]
MAVTQAYVEFRLDAWKAQYERFLSDVNDLTQNMRKSAVRDNDAWSSGYKAGAAAAYQHMYDDLLALYHDYCALRRLLAQQQTEGMQNTASGDDYTTPEAMAQGSVEA